MCAMVSVAVHSLQRRLFHSHFPFHCLIQIQIINSCKVFHKLTHPYARLSSFHHIHILRLLLLLLPLQRPLLFEHVYYMTHCTYHVVDAAAACVICVPQIDKIFVTQSRSGLKENQSIGAYNVLVNSYIPIGLNN